METQEKNTNNTTFNRLSTVLFYLTILFFVIAFNFRDAMTPSVWYQQFMPNLNGRQIVDITFTDSLNGYAITNRLTSTDTSFILKTTNSGDNWFVSRMDSGFIYKRVQFINQNTGFVCGAIYANSNYYLLKTTNTGVNWFYINAPFQHFADDMFALNEDTIWFADQNGFDGGVFRTTNSGVNWVQQYGSNQNPSHIYMYNARIGFMDGGTLLRRTTDGGFNWTVIPGEGEFTDMFFIDSLTGWKCSGGMKKSTDGGLNWISLAIPSGGNIINPVLDFSVVNRDTIWGCGGAIIFPNSQVKSILYRTTNGGNNWFFQIPDTSIIGTQYFHIRFTDKLKGWAYGNMPRGIHTTTGGDTIFYLAVEQISNEVPKEFKLFQNFPNPFNPSTVIRYQLRVSSNIKLSVFDITGKEVITIVNQKQNAGTYEVDFNGSGYSSGVYFYQLTIINEQSAEVYRDTKKMLLIK